MMTMNFRIQVLKNCYKITKVPKILYKDLRPIEYSITAKSLDILKLAEVSQNLKNFK